MPRDEDLPPKARIVPLRPIAMRDRLGPKANISLSLMTFRSGEMSAGPSVQIPWPMCFTIRDEADAADPLNQLRQYVLNIGDALVYRATLVNSENDDDALRLAVMAFVVLGVEHGDEIRAAIEAERRKAADAA